MNIKHQWLSDPDFRAEWREYLLKNIRSNTDYLLSQGALSLIHPARRKRK